jgi:hypothetical protein
MDMTSKRKALVGALAGIGLAVAMAVSAQPAGDEWTGCPGGGVGAMGGGPGMGHGWGPGMGRGAGMGPGTGQGMGPGMGRGYGAAGNVDRTAAAGQRLADMKAQLKITGAQESAWQAYANAVQGQAAIMQAVHEQMWSGGTMTAPDRLALRSEAMQKRAAGMVTLSKAFGELYATLTPEQKAIADQYAGPMGSRAMGYGRRAG